MPLLTDFLLWLDLETTGSDESKDSIIEVGAILTTPDLDDVAEYQSIVLPTDEALGRLLRNPVVKDMHRANGLLDQLLMLESGPKPHAVATELLGWLDERTVADDSIVLAGSGVGHFDRRFLERWMPQVARRLRYWCIDVGVVRRAYAMWTDTAEVHPEHVPGKTHRALDDARFHLEEARMWRRMWREAEATMGERA